MYIVIKAFKTPIRKFSVGQEVAGADLSGPVTLNQWITLGCLASKPAAKPNTKGGKAGQPAA